MTKSNLFAQRGTTVVLGGVHNPKQPKQLLLNDIKNLPGGQGVAGSNPVAPTDIKRVS
jgi:hypothetical protein